jgi:ATP-dependent DNA helicase RecG
MALEDRARRVLLHEQRTNHADVAVRPGGLARFFEHWAAEASAAGHPLSRRLPAMFADYAALDPMQRTARVRAALALLEGAAQPVAARAPVRPELPSPAQPLSPAPPAQPEPASTPSPAPKPRARAHHAAPAHSGDRSGEYLLDAPVTAVPGVGSAIAARLRKVGIDAVRDLLYYLPREHHDYSALLKIAQLPFDEMVTVTGIIWEVENVAAANRRVTRTIARISDESGQIRVVWFNQPFLLKQLPRGAQIVVTGVKQRFGNAVQLTARSHELPEQGDLLSTGRLVPIYPLTEGLSAKTVRRATKWAVDRCAHLLTDYLPESVRASADLMPLAEAIAAYHYPDDVDELVDARHRLAFDEMFIVQLGMLARRASWHVGLPAPVVRVPRGSILSGEPIEEPAPIDPLPAASLWNAAIPAANCFEESLPFAFTAAQRRVIGEILDDLACDRPMCRLLQGDVGSGKTAVAASALLAVVLAGYQGAIMAPTEILAEQHARALTRMLDPFGIGVAYLAGSQRARERSAALAAVASGEAQVAVGTHALIQETVEFARLGLAVVDEQHRFGVEQREDLRRKSNGLTPHLLVMTATPIPRTLALAVYGDLDLSTLDEMPHGRLPVITRWRAGDRREEAYALMAFEVAQGRQGYIICPLIEESEALEAKAATAEFERLRADIFPTLRLGLVHGAMRSAEKDATMRRFRDGAIDILVATAVVEVGVDVPNATMMIIEDADRFGLAQLHQFRGRVGRSDQQSYCYLLSQDAGALARERLSVVERTTDGFKLAEADLRLRGPGEFFGTRQSGLPELRVAELTDGPLISEARREAEALWSIDPFLHAPEHTALRERVAAFWESYTPQ